MSDLLFLMVVLGVVGIIIILSFVFDVIRHRSTKEFVPLSEEIPLSEEKQPIPPIKMGREKTNGDGGPL